jgi:hypothetical protein
MVMEAGAITALIIAVAVALAFAVAIGALATRVSSIRHWVAGLARSIAQRSNRGAGGAGFPIYAEFYATIPSTAPVVVYPGTTIAYPSDGNSGGNGIVRVAPDQFMLKAVGTYRVRHSGAPVAVSSLLSSTTSFALIAGQAIVVSSGVIQTVQGNVSVSPGTTIPTSTALPIGEANQTLPYVGADPTATSATANAIAIIQYVNSLPGGTALPAALPSTVPGPGVYNIPNGATLSGTLNLTAPGSYYFRFAGTFATIGSTPKIVCPASFTGGALPLNVYFVAVGNITTVTATSSDAQFFTSSNFTDAGNSSFSVGVYAPNGTITLGPNTGTAPFGIVGFLPVGAQVAVSLADGGSSSFAELPSTYVGSWQSSTLADTPLVRTTLPNSLVRIVNPAASGLPFVLPGGVGGANPTTARLNIQLMSPATA